ncbi:MAG: NAD(P)/FAD-dependent oxidoreductase [Clostridia bacterium]|nr:NAD(P)/FAD-dependent oxidoreductase [Clostridia bacterium]
MTDVIVVGGGAAGMMAAGTASQRGLKTMLFERNDILGKKLMITGKGRCNVTNDCKELETLIKNVVSNGKFLYSSFSSFMPEDTVDFFESRGVKLKVERGKRVFPVSDKAVDIVRCLEKFVSDSGVQVVNDRVKKLILRDGRAVGVETYQKKQYFANSVILATGGKSYPKTGSTGDGYFMAKQCGHTVTELKPSLVALETCEGFCREMMGLSLRNVEVKLEDKKKGKTIFTDFGEMLFTHFGVSGPLVLSASAHIRQMEEGRYVLHIDLKSALDFSQLDKRLLRELLNSSNRNFSNVLETLLPKKLVPVFVERTGIDASTKANQLTKLQRQRVIELLKDFSVTVKSFRPIDEAVITSGGVSVKEVDPKTMESKIVKGLYFCGEILDVDAYTGGFNLQIAFSTARTAGNSVNKGAK